MKIILVNHTFQIPRFYKRWQMLAKQHPELDVTLITPLKMKWDIKGSMIFGTDTVLEGQKIDEGNFHILPVKIEENRYLDWGSQEMIKAIRNLQPDIVYHIGGHTQRSLMQCIHAVRKYLNEKAKVIAFSMRGPTNNTVFPHRRSKESITHLGGRIISYFIRRERLRYLNKYCDAVICHYPDAVECFKEEGFKKPIYISTQVGVDTDVYHPDEQARQRIREKLNLEDSFVFGCACRFIPYKGLFEIVEALPQEGNWKCLLMGKGEDDFTNSLKQLIKKRNLQDKVILTGYIDWKEIADYWNAIDCALHVPRTTEQWQETFSLAVVQAMAIGKPIIGNDCGSVPYQIGPDGIIVSEGDIERLHDKMRWMIEHQNEAKNIGAKMKEYAVNSFSIKHLNEHFYDIINDIYSDVYDERKIDMVTYPCSNE